jgi:hypothetical protein
MSDSEQTASLDIDHLDGHEFETLIGKLLEKMGFVIGERKLSVDGGIDILAKNYEPILEGTYIIQCKRHSKKVGQHIIRDLYGVVHSRNANKGILITNSTFTDLALKFAQDKQLELIDGEKLHALLIKHGIVQAGKDVVVLPNSARYLLNDFVPALRKMQKEVDDINNGLVYVEKSNCTPKKWANMLETKIHKLNAYCEFVTRTLNQCFGEVSLEKDYVAQIREASSRITEATQKLIRDYEELFGVIPPQGLEKPHRKFMDFYTQVFGTLWQIANDIETATARPEPKKYQISVVFNIDEEGKKFHDEVEIALEEMNAKTKNPSSVSVIVALGFIFFIIVMIIYFILNALR